jgi:hypothetical protein
MVTSKAAANDFAAAFFTRLTARESSRNIPEFRLGVLKR